MVLSDFRKYTSFLRSSFDLPFLRPSSFVPSHVSFSSEREESRATRFGDYNERLIRLPMASTFSNRRRQTVSYFKLCA